MNVASLKSCIFSPLSLTSIFFDIQHDAVWKTWAVNNPRSWGKRPFSCRGHVKSRYSCYMSARVGASIGSCNLEFVSDVSFISLVHASFHTQCGLTSGSVVWDISSTSVHIFFVWFLYVLNLPWAFSKSPNNSHIGPQQFALHPSHLDLFGGSFLRWEQGFARPSSA